jgi:hypothetical protein
MLAAMFFIPGCNTDTVNPIDHTDQPITLGVPYVESVQLPAHITAGQPFSIEIKLSAQANPNALRGPAHPFPGYELAVGRENLLTKDVSGSFVVCRPWRDPTHFSDAGQPVTSITYDIPALQAGPGEFRYWTTATREFGGSDWIVFNYLAPNESNPEKVVLKTLDFTVEPAL